MANRDRVTFESWMNRKTDTKLTSEQKHRLFVSCCIMCQDDYNTDSTHCLKPEKRVHRIFHAKTISMFFW